MFRNGKFRVGTAITVLAAMLMQPFSALAAASPTTAALATPALVKIAPVAVSVDTAQLAPQPAGEENQAVWRLFDNDTASGYAPVQPTRVSVTLPAPASIGSIRFFGPSSYQLNVYRDNAGAWEPVPSLSGKSLTALKGNAWNTLSADAPVAAGTLLLEFNPQGNVTVPVSEVEVWGAPPAAANSDVPYATLAGIKNPKEVLALLSKGNSHIFTVAATPSEISIPDGSENESASAFASITVAQNPSLFKRAYLIYDGLNIVRPVSIQKRINNGSWSGGFIVPQPEGTAASWRSQVEEINPAWLLQGENRLEFRSPAGTAAIRNLSLLVETDSGWNSVASVSAPGVYDGDTSTSFAIHASGSNPDLQVNFERSVEPEKIRLHVSGAVRIKASLQYLSGGVWQDVKQGWQLDLSSLKAGWNEVALPAQVATTALRMVFDTQSLRLKTGAASGSIDELRVCASPVGTLSAQPRIVVSYPRDGEYFGRTASIQGFVTPATNEAGVAANLSIAGKSSANADGAFSVSLTKDETGYADDPDDTAWGARATTDYAGVPGTSNAVSLNRNFSAGVAPANAESRANASFADNRDKHSEKVVPGQAKKIVYEGVTLDIPEGAVDQETEITVIPLTEADLARLDPGMVNVTYPAAGYRFLPHGMKFKKPIKISFGYSKKLFAAGQTDNDVSMFFYNESLLRWQPLTRANVDTTKTQVVSESDHFTDIINSTLVVPEHPQALSFNPNSIKDIKAADPSANVELIEPPKVNNKGTANLSYPIDLPAGRSKLQPSLAVQYNSSGGNGWMGVGWDIPVQAISIDTRWGVPRYDAASETETYTLDGEQLAPVAHRGAPIKRSDGTTLLNGEVVKVFHPRVEGSFRKIIRHGTSPVNYWWEVVDKNGSKYFYGGTPGANNIPGNDATLAVPGTGNVFKWALRQIRDTNGNTVNYSYAVASNTGIVGGSVPGYQIYLQKIDYTGHNDEPGAYSVLFTRDRDLPNFIQRPDVSIDARGRFKMVTADLLKRVEVHFRNAQGQDTTVRSYAFDYVEGAFRKTLLQAVSQYGASGTFFNKHEFSYYDSARQGDGSYSGFGSSTTWDTGKDDVGKKFLGLSFPASALGGSEGTNVGGSLYVGFGIEAVKYVSGGGKLGVSSSDTEGLIAMVDIDGDGLADKVFKCGDGVCYRLNTSGPHANLGGITFGTTHHISGGGVSQISKDHSTQISGGLQGFIAGASAVFDVSSTMTTQSAYFADVNGDGLVDLVKNGSVSFNTGKTDADKNLIFSANSYDTPAPIVGPSSVNATDMLPDFSDLYAQMENQSPLLDGVRRWVASYDGTIGITGGAQLADTTKERVAKGYTTADGVRIAVQKEGSELWSDTIGVADFSVHTPTGLNNIKVSKGDRIYFRVQSVSDGSYDQVSWNPVITYAGASTAQTDVNGLPVYQFTAGDDMVYGGREFPINLPFKGKVRFIGDLHKLGVTTDDVALVVYLNDVEVRRTTLPWNLPGSITLPDMDVQYKDVIKLKVLADSDIDQRQIDWAPQMFYVQATYPDVVPLDGNGNPAKDADGNLVGPPPGSPVTVQDDQGQYTVQLKPLYDVDFYPANALSAPQQSWTATQTGSLLVTPYLASASSDPNLTFNFNSALTFTAKRRNALLGKSVITATAGSSYIPQQHSFQVPVTAGDELFFDFSTRDQNLAAMLPGVYATVRYVTPASSVRVDNIAVVESGTANPPQQSWNAAQNGMATIRPILVTPDGSPLGFDGSVTLNVTAVQNGETSAFTRTIAILKGVVPDPLTYAFDLPVASGAKLSFSYTTPDASILGQLATGAVDIDVTNSAGIDVPAPLHSHMLPNVFSKPYRGWGYIAYNGNRSRATEPIHQELLTLSANPGDYNRPLPTSASPTNTSPLDFYTAIPDAFQGRWTGPDQNWWIAPEVTSSSRLGIQYVSVPTADKYNGAAAPSKITKSTQMSLGAGYYVAVSGTTAPNKTIMDYMDLNGDGFPDVVGQGNVQYSTMLGTLNPSSSKPANFGSVRETETDSLTLGPGGTVPDTQTGSDKKPPAKPESQNPSYGLNGSLGKGWSSTTCDMMDVNGDGLPDSVCQNGDKTVSVKLNLGYDFAPAENWGTANMNDGSSTSGSLSFSYSDGVKGFAGGPSVSTSKAKNEAQFIDMNGDGLLDRVYNDGNIIHVGFNTGAGFAPPVLWSGNLDYRINSSLNASLGAGASYYFSIGPLCVLACFIIINPELNGGMSMSREESTLRDVKGDGTADHLYSSTDNSLQVAVNRTENTNLLKSVKRPLGGTISLYYQREGNTTEMPQSQWTLKSSTLTDGKGNSYVSAFSYADGYKDRLERDFYGFRTVTETHAPGAKTPDPVTGTHASDTSIERSITETFHTAEFNDERDFYLKGLLLKSVTTDKQGNVWASTANTYTPAPVIEGKDAVAYAQFPALTRTDTYFYDGATAESGYKKSTFQTFVYDTHGNVTTFFDAGELATSADDVTATISYWQDPQEYIIKPDTIEVKDAAGKNTLRKRWASYENGTGNLRSHTSLATSGQSPVWQMSYDGYGNIQTITDPVGYKLTYSYDNDTNSYVTRVEDNFSARDGGIYYSTAGYDLIFGQPLWTKDLNGNYEARRYDEFGRLISVHGPYDTDSAGNPQGLATLAFEYKAPVVAIDGENLATPASAVTRNKAVSRVGSVGKTLDTVTFIDGMKRLLQTKKEADVNGVYGMVVSGPTVYDALGRSFQQGQPVFQSGGDLYGYLSLASPKNPTNTYYDALDRSVIVETPDSKGDNGYAVTTTSYGFGTLNNSGLLYATTKVVDPIGYAADEANRKGTKVSFKDVDGRIAAVVEYNHGAPIVTSYAYDPLGQITTVVDDRKNTTTVEYDMIGRRTAIVNPDTGRTQYGYDANGNLTSKLSANYQQGKEIKYDYVFNRLMRINYPYSANVIYEYGPMNAAYNRAGRITKVTDESGVEERYYGKLGETTREVKSVDAKTPSAQRKSYTTDYVFDSFGRMNQMTYPDGETLYYGYDNGGLLNAAWGGKQGNRYNYINTLTYDEFGQRKHIAYGNGVLSDYSYDDKTRRLAALTTTTPDTRTIQNLSYDYDLVGNILKVQNQIATSTNTALPAGPLTQIFEYDDLYQIRTANGEYAFGPGKQNLYNNEFFYDTIGNFTRKGVINKILQPSLAEHLPKETNYVLDYKYGSSHPHAVTNAGEKTYSYDANGNMTGWTSNTNGQKRTILWNEENRVKEIDDSGKATYFLYDDAGERVLKRGQHGETFYLNRFYSMKNGELGTKSIYAGNTRVVTKLVKTPNTTTDNTAVSIPGIQGLNHGIGNKTGIINRLPGGTTTGILPPEEKDQYFYHGDHLGSSNMITDAKGSVYQHLEYFPFGETWIDEGKTPTNIPGYQFTGKELDPETGLYYFGARYYEPVISKWISVDPILGHYLQAKHNGGVYSPGHLTLYGYVQNNPLKYIDIDGEAELRFIGGAKSADLSAYSRQVLSDVGDRAGVSTLYVTSTKRTPKEQAQAMYNNLKHKKTAKDLYKGAGLQVENVYQTQKKEGKAEKAIISAMENKMEEIGPEKVSKHMGDFSKVNVADISNSMLPADKRNAFKDAVKSDKRINKYLYPPKDPANHIEIPQPNPAQGGH